MQVGNMPLPMGAMLKALIGLKWALKYFLLN